MVFMPVHVDSGIIRLGICHADWTETPEFCIHWVGVVTSWVAVLVFSAQWTGNPGWYTTCIAGLLESIVKLLFHL
jgi:hypothetical protein